MIAAAGLGVYAIRNIGVRSADKTMYENKWKMKAARTEQQNA